jgi:hypothetical protein
MLQWQVVWGVEFDLILTVRCVFPAQVAAALLGLPAAQQP